nr:MAG: capsid protein [Cressdnaviricota sp.]
MRTPPSTPRKRRRPSTPKRKGRWRNLAGYAAATTLGFISGGPAGAAAGYSAYSSYTNSIGAKKRKTSKFFKRVAIKRRVRVVKKMPAITLSDTHQGVSGRSAKVVIRSKPLRNVKGGTISYYQSYLKQSAGDAGKQAVVDAFSFGNVSQWMTSSGTSYGSAVPTGTGVRFFDLNYNQYLSGPVAGAHPTVVPNNDTLALHRSRLHMVVANATNVGVHMNIYVLRVKRDTSISPKTAWDNGLQAAGLSSNDAGTFPAAGVTGGGFGYPSSSFNGAKPTDVKLFNSLYKVEKVFALHMAGNAQEELDIDLIHNYVAKEEVMTVLKGNNDLYCKDAVCILTVGRAELVLDVTTGTGHLATTAPVCTQIACFADHQFKMVAGNAARLDNSAMFAGYIPTAAPPSSLYTINAVDAETNLIENI